MLGRYLRLVKFQHTVFALPFAAVAVAFAVADGGRLTVLNGLLVLGCMVTARNAAMGFNRWADRRLDAANPRTAVREIPAGQLSAQAALTFVVVNVTLFVGFTYLLNPLVWALSPVALAVVLGYSYTKRFTALCHMVLGVGLGLAPVGAYLALTAAFAVPPVLLGVAVLTWVAGFDILYSLQDEAFDRNQGLFSIPVWLGGPGAVRLARTLHGVTALLLAGVGLLVPFGLLGWVAYGLFAASLIRQHTLVSAQDISRINLAFFTTNGLASLAFGGLVVTEIVLRLRA